MNIGVLGSGIVGQTVAAKFASLGHDVVIGTRNPNKLEEWLAKLAHQPRIATFAEAAAHGELVVNATSGQGSLAALQQAGAGNLKGKILVDIANPLDFSQGMPPSLTVCNTDSLGEQIQRAFPDVKVVKTLNTVTAALMVDPGLVNGGDHNIFMSGNDPEAKVQVAAILRDWLGWQHVVDLGDITTARGTEMMLAAWIRLLGVLGTPMFNFKIVQ